MPIGSNIHPTETSGDGKVIEQSKYIKKTDRLDNIVNCAQCGFPVNLDKRSTGDDFYTLDASITTSTETFTPPGPGTSQSDTFGEPADDPGKGCPLCRSMNPRGINRNKRFGSGINLENL